VATASGSNTVFVAGGSIGGTGPRPLVDAGLEGADSGRSDTLILAGGSMGGGTPPSPAGAELAGL
jgi:hypothetical protein